MGVADGLLPIAEFGSTSSLEFGLNLQVVFVLQNKQAPPLGGACLNLAIQSQLGTTDRPQLGVTG